MNETKIQNLREQRPHGTVLFPCAVYRCFGNEGTLRVKPHWHEEIEIIYLKSGKYSLTINMEPFEVSRECFFFINRGELHQISSLTADFQEMAIVFDPQLLRFQTYDPTDEYIIHPLIAGTLTYPRYMNSSHPAFLRFRQEYDRIIQAFCRGQQVPPTGEQVYTTDTVSHLQTKASLLQMLALLSEYGMMDGTWRPENHRVESVKTVLTYIGEHYQEKLYVRDLSDLANMNEQYFCRFFKKAVGKSPIDYINDVRLTQVIRLLESTELPVTQICLECGFNNIGNFQRLFRRKTGTTPLQYRKTFFSNKSK